jgi:hypothetical protein
VPLLIPELRALPGTLQSMEQHLPVAELKLRATRL